MAAVGLIAASFITVIYCIWVYNFYRLKKGKKPLSRPLTPEEKRRRLEALHRAEAEMEREDEEWWQQKQEEAFWWYPFGKDVSAYGPNSHYFPWQISDDDD